ncbi:hypothetical protein BD410DRAFT_472791 [Rickenella mellea]|uniref:Uncharacterized protein n=1 Tax=Rickenella mellea TaxID=50990 RepID=A0A4Y7QGT0_9AGAM|nr:hypothetical protein BD410DRAFT_472791 [Rickenella mellea]
MDITKLRRTATLETRPTTRSYLTQSKHGWLRLCIMRTSCSSNPYELPLSKSVTVPITDIFNGLCWLASVTLLNAEVRSSPKWYSRRLAIFAKIFQTVKDWLLGGLEEPMNNAFPYCICVVLSTNPCFSVGKSGFADDGRMRI